MSSNYTKVIKSDAAECNPKFWTGICNYGYNTLQKVSSFLYNFLIQNPLQYDPTPTSQTLLPLRLSNNEYACIFCLSVRATHFSNLINPRLKAIPKFKKKTLRSLRYIYIYIYVCVCVWAGGTLDSVVGIATHYGLDGQRIGTVRGSNPACGEIFRTRPDRLWGPPSLPYNGYRGKAAGALRWPPTPSSAEVKERVELYLYSPSGPSWPVLGSTLPYTYTYIHTYIYIYIYMLHDSSAIPLCIRVAYF